MPRKAKTTLSGAKAQAPAVPVGRGYGTGVQAEASQRAMPLPKVQAANGGAGRPPEGGGPPAPAAAPGPGGGGDPERLMAALAQAQQMEPPTSALTGPSQRPNEHIGGANGAAPTPKLRPNESLYELRALAARFPYPDLLRLVERVERES